MNTKHYLAISGIIGGVIGSLLTAMLVSPELRRIGINSAILNALA